MRHSYIVAVTAAVVAILLLFSYVTQPSDETGEAEEPTGEGMTFTLLSDGTAALSGYTGRAEDLVIPGTVEIDGTEYVVSSILYGALNDSETILRVTVPAGVTSIAATALSIQSLTWIEVEDGNAVYSSVDGVLFDQDGTRLYQFPPGRTGPYTVPDGVTTIGDAAFALSSLTEVTVSDGVTSMGMSVFAESTELEVVRVGAGLSSMGNWCLSHCPSLTWIEVDDANPYYDSVDGVLYTEGMGTLLRFPQARGGSFEIPSEVASVGLYAFAYNTSLDSVTIPSGVTSIGVCAFLYCWGLEGIVIEGAVPSIGELAFCLSDGTVAVSCTVYGPVGCLDGYTGSDTRLDYFDEGAGEALIGGVYCSVIDGEAEVTGFLAGLSEAVIPSSLSLGGTVVPVTSVSIEPSFDYDMTIEVLTIPATVTSVEPDSLWNLHALTEVVLEQGNPTLSVVDGVLFDQGGTRLLAYPSARAGSSYAVPEGVTAVADHAFAGSVNLESLDLTGVIVVGVGAASSCTALRSVDLGGTVVTVSDEAFAYDPLLTTVTGTEAVGLVGEGAFIISPVEGISLPAATRIGDRAFYGCTSLQSVALGSGVAYVGEQAFYGCLDLWTLVLDCPGAEIGDEAFVLSDEYITICFAYIPGMGSHGILDAYSNDLTWIYYIVADGDTGFEYALCDGGVEVTGYRGEAVHLSIPSAFESDGVTYDVVSIRTGTFMQRTSLVTVTIPGSVVNVGSIAFMLCTSLESVTMGEGTVTIGEQAFYGCASLTEVVLPSTLSVIESQAFYGCPISTLTVPSVGLVVGNDAFGLLSGEELEITVYAAVPGVIDDGLGEGAVADYRDLPGVPASSLGSGDPASDGRAFGSKFSLS